MKPALPRACVIACEHGGNRLPDRYRAVFRQHLPLLRSHEGYDRGALRLAREISAALGGEHHYSVVSRLLIDLNRSLGHPDNLSSMTRSLGEEAVENIVQKYYLPYRSAVERSIAKAIQDGKQVLHLSCHSFAPVVDGEHRNAHVGLLFDPVRREEARLCGAWQAALQSRMPELIVRMNYPYLGVDDGLVTTLRAQFPDPLYAGVELEVRQDQVMRPDVRRALVDSIRQVWQDEPGVPAKVQS